MKLVLSLVFLVMTASASAQPYPAKPVRLVVPYAAGGPADLLTREIAKGLQESIGQPVIVDPRPGGGSVIGADAVAEGAAHGQPLLLSTAAPPPPPPAVGGHEG